MGAGYNAMNDLVIIQTSQGLAKYVENTIPDAKERGVVISFDHRYNSHRYSNIVSIPIPLGFKTVYSSAIL